MYLIPFPPSLFPNTPILPTTGRKHHFYLIDEKRIETKREKTFLLSCLLFSLSFSFFSFFFSFFENYFSARVSARFIYSISCLAITSIAEFHEKLQIFVFLLNVLSLVDCRDCELKVFFILISLGGGRRFVRVVVGILVFEFDLLYFI